MKKLVVMAVAMATIAGLTGCDGLMLADPDVSVGVSTGYGPYYDGGYYSGGFYDPWYGSGYWPDYIPGYLPAPAYRPPVHVRPGGIINGGVGPVRPPQSVPSAPANRPGGNPGVSGIPVSPSQRPGGMGTGIGRPNVGQGSGARPSTAVPNTQLINR